MTLNFLCSDMSFYIRLEHKINMEVMILLFFLSNGFLILFVEVTHIFLFCLFGYQDKSLSLFQKYQKALNNESFKENVSFLPQTQESASSAKTSHFTIDYVPEKHNYIIEDV